MYAKSVDLLCAGNKDFVKYQAQGGGFNPKFPPCVRPCSRLLPRKHTETLVLLSVKYLGVLLDKLSWKPHVQKVKLNYQELVES